MWIIFLLFILFGISVLLTIFSNPVFLLLAIIILGLWVLAAYDYIQKGDSIMRNFPLIGRTRYLAEWMRPKIYQYFVESDTGGKPFSRQLRSIIYHRSNKELDTSPFGTQMDVYATGYEWMNHSITPIDFNQIDHDPRCRVGGPDCLKPYDLSLYNVSAMSYGSLSKNAIMALNGGAKIGGFAHNTGEGGVSPYHLEPGGDIIYQIGTGYFGSRGKDGRFSDEAFVRIAHMDQVKMIELKLSQGAKPGHGGILPGKKVDEEIAAIRGVEVGKDVLSPPYHREFSDPVGLLIFINKLRQLSGGKPIGIKLCIGSRAEFLALCKAMIKTGIMPDFITIDGGEGGTGAAPLEFSDSVGMPMKEGLAFAYDALTGFDLKKHIKLIAAGKIVTGFHIYRALALGADACYSARAMMMALGCIQALECNKNTCPVGVATNDPNLMRGLDVNDKKVRVAQFHKETIRNFVELQGAAGQTIPELINRSDINRRIENYQSMRYDEIYPYIIRGSLLEMDECPKEWKYDLGRSSSESFKPKYMESFEGL
jgi:glutamate synthase domain-containing protein 2